MNIKQSLDERYVTEYLDTREMLLRVFLIYINIFDKKIRFCV